MLATSRDASHEYPDRGVKAPEPDVKSLEMPVLAGRRISPEATLALAELLKGAGSDSTAGLLLDAVTTGAEFVALSTDDRLAILAVLNRPPDELRELRTVLYYEVMWRRNAELHGRRRPRPARA